MDVVRDWLMEGPAAKMLKTISVLIHINFLPIPMAVLFKA